jgi:HTH-type transcriptional regulator / antitoxin HigA
MTLAIKPVGPRYWNLLHEIPLRPLRTKAEHAQAAKLLARLAGRTAPLSQDESDYMLVLSRLVEDWDKAHPFLHKKPSPIELLRSLMAENGMNVTALGQIIGSQSAASLILAGKRSISKAQMRKLGDRFKVNPGLFLGD